MTFSDQDILAALKSGRIVIRPRPNLEEQLGPCSIDLHLGDTFQVFQHTKLPYVDLKNKIDFESLMSTVVVKGGDPFIMQQGDFVLASTTEHIEFADDLMGRVDGRSSLARLGIVVHSTAGRFDPGWRGVVTVELGNLGVMPVTLYPGMRICSMSFEELKTPSSRPYWKNPKAKYAGAKIAETSKLALEFESKAKKK